MNILWISQNYLLYKITVTYLLIGVCVYSRTRWSL